MCLLEHSNSHGRNSAQFRLIYADKSISWFNSIQQFDKMDTYRRTLPQQLKIKLCLQFCGELFLFTKHGLIFLWLSCHAVNEFSFVDWHAGLVHRSQGCWTNLLAGKLASGNTRVYCGISTENHKHCITLNTADEFEWTLNVIYWWKMYIFIIFRYHCIH